MWGSEGSGEGEFVTPYSVFVAPDNKVYVTDSGNACVQYFSAAGSYLGKWGTRGSGNGEFQGPVDVNVAANGYIYVADLPNHRIQYFKWEE
jgi:DNA-binding beta-propeller fold protein YncE